MDDLPIFGDTPPTFDRPPLIGSDTVLGIELWRVIEHHFELQPEQIENAYFMGKFCGCLMLIFGLAVEEEWHAPANVQSAYFDHIVTWQRYQVLFSESAKAFTYASACEGGKLHLD